MKTFNMKVAISFARLNELHEIVSLTAQELYDRYGIWRSETLFSFEAEFDDGRKMVLSWQSADEPDGKAQICVQLIDEDGCICDVSEDYDDNQVLGVFEATDECLHEYPEVALTGKEVDTSRGHFRVVDMSPAQMRNAGYGYHHRSDDGKWFIFSKNNRAFAVSAENIDKLCYNSYKVEITLERCAVALNCDNGNCGEYTACIDSKWLLEKYGSYFDDEFGGLFQFLGEYTSEDSNEIISDAILSGAVLFTCDPDKDAPFSFPCDDGWKYMAFADAISNILDESNQDASKAIDCLLSL